MLRQLKEIRNSYKSDYLYSTITSSSVSLVINSAFTIFNGILGIVYHSLWNGSICVYYFLLAVIRTIIVNEQRKESRLRQRNCKKRRRKTFIITHILLLLMNITLIVPIIVMIKGERSYTYGLIPAIALAVYTTYRITMGIIHFKKSFKSKNLLVSELRTINLIDSLLALLTLQNAMIIANGGMNNEMKTLSAWTSVGVFVLIIILTIFSFLKVKRRKSH